MEPFRHTPLEQNKTQFRLLSLTSIDVNSGEGTDIRNNPGGSCYMIHCSLEHFEFCQEGLPDYKAISYTWGPEAPLYTILVNGKPFSVRQNLWGFLQQYSRGLLELEKSLLWVDQICIDQKSLSEKGHQLGLMSRIYSQASQVISWLGVSAYREATLLLATETFFSDPYWTRLWVAQEIMLAKEWIVLHDGAAILGDDIIYTIRNYMPMHHVARARWVLHRTTLAFRSTPPSLAVVMSCFAHLRCDDPRDKVFALLALTGDRESVDLDYNLSPITIFWNTFRALERTEAGLIDPTPIAQIARDMGVIDDRLVRIDEGLTTSRFQYLSMQDIHRKIKNRDMIMCAPWISHEKAGPPDEGMRPVFATKWAWAKSQTDSARRLPSLKYLGLTNDSSVDNYSAIMNRAEHAQRNETISNQCLADLRTVLDEVTARLELYPKFDHTFVPNSQKTMDMDEMTGLIRMRDALRRREIQLVKSQIEDVSLQERKRRELTHFLARQTPIMSPQLPWLRKDGTGQFHLVRDLL